LTDLKYCILQICLAVGTSKCNQPWFLLLQTLSNDSAFPNRAEEWDQQCCRSSNQRQCVSLDWMSRGMQTKRSKGLAPLLTICLIMCCRIFTTIKQGKNTLFYCFCISFAYRSFKIWNIFKGKERQG
jgi:hypothetical protein